MAKIILARDVGAFHMSLAKASAAKLPRRQRSRFWWLVFGQLAPYAEWRKRWPSSWMAKL